MVLDGDWLLHSVHGSRHFEEHHTCEGLIVWHLEVDREDDCHLSCSLVDEPVPLIWTVWDLAALESLSFLGSIDGLIDRCSKEVSLQLGNAK